MRRLWPEALARAERVRSRRSRRPPWLVAAVAAIVVAIVAVAAAVRLNSRAQDESSLQAVAAQLHNEITALGTADYSLANPLAWDPASIAQRGLVRSAAAHNLVALLTPARRVPGVTALHSDMAAALADYDQLNARATAVFGTGRTAPDPAGAAGLTAEAEQNASVFVRAASDAHAVTERLESAAAGAKTLRGVGIGSAAALLIGLAFIAVLAEGRRRRLTAVRASERRTQRRFEALIEHASDLTALTDPSGNFEYVSPSVVRLLGYPARSFDTILQARVVQPDDGDLLRRMIAAARSSGHAGPEKLRVRVADGSLRVLSIRADDLTGVEEVGAMLWTARDVTDQARLEEELARQAFHDALTGLANRALFRDRLDRALARAARERRPVAVLLADLDGFKSVNDSLGHDAGDAVLVEVAGRLRGCLRAYDTVARMGGDEFTVLLEDLPSRVLAEEIAERVEAALRHPVTVGTTELHLGVSIGIAYAESGTETSQELLRNADVAMYSAKSSGKGRWTTFEPAMAAEIERELVLTADLDGAIERGEFEVHYQPIYRLETGEVIGAEALLRWQHPTEGAVPPAVFIPLAEQSGRIADIGLWVLEEACRRGQAWHARQPDTAPLTVAVNLSARQLADDRLVGSVAMALSRTGLDPEALVLEITESGLMGDIATAVARLGELKALGIRLAIDDFGTGYSSLAYLRQFPVDILKIDRSFVQGAASGVPGSAALIQAIIDLAARLKLTTIAEGIETRAQADGLVELGCPLGQGYWFARPMPEAEFQRFLDHRAGPTLPLPGRKANELAT
ncbi:MAG TPA: EAL domain-containing protein [Actinomycetota bacterium]|nr:EAL domain-containing protein [Actinomycetota bacterium]